MTRQQQETTEMVNRLRRQGIKAWRPTGLSKVRALEYIIRLCHRIRPDDPQAAMHMVAAEIERKKGI